MIFWRVLLVLCWAATAFGQQGVEIAVRPAVPKVEVRGREQLLNFDLLLTNRRTVALQVVAVKLAVFDRAERLELQREVNLNGHPAAMDLVIRDPIAAGQTVDLFFPFVQFDQEMELHRLVVTVLLMETGHTAPPVALTADVVERVEVKPEHFGPTAFCLPLSGLLLVHDGHDYLSHHRRFDLAKLWRTDPAAAVSPNLYAYDLVSVGEAGELFRGEPGRLDNWLTYGQAVYAPAGGIVTEAMSAIPENSLGPGGAVSTSPEAEKMDPRGMGNHVAIRHPDGRVSWLLHLRQGSVTVRAGETVATGQKLGVVGFSGDSLFPHLHYTVTESEKYPAQGVPSYFRDFVRLMGSRTIPVRGGQQIDTGDVAKSSCISKPVF